METSISLNQYIISVMCSASCLSCVVGIAVEAFLRYKMETDIRGFSTIIAQDPNLHVKDNTISVLGFKMPIK